MAGETLAGPELTARADQVAAALHGVRVLAVDATATLSTVVAIVAALRSGIPVAPLPPDSGPAERAYLVRDSGAELVLSDRALPAGRPEDRLRVPVLPAGRLVGRVNGTGPSRVPIEPSATGLIMYTSGTTGHPKGVALSRAALAADLDGLAAAWRWTCEDTLVHGLPLFHVHGLVLGVLGALRVGSDLVHTGRPTPEAYAAAAGSLYFGVPTVWSRVCADPAAAAALRSARLLVSGSAALPVPVFDRLTELTGHVPIERYGMTETLITISTTADGERRPGWVGRPIDGVQARIVDDTGALVPADGQTPGHLQIRGATMFDGYLNNPAATAEAVATDGWFTTGDLALHDETGFVRLLGRAKTDLISSGGYRIGAGEIEDALLAHPAVAEAAVVGTPHPDLGQQVCAFVVVDGRTQGGTTEDLMSFVGERLSAHKRPRRIVFVDALPRNAMGKVVKADLRLG